MRNALVGLLLFVTPFGAFAGEVHDPSHLLERIATARVLHPFDENFRIGDVATVRRFNQDCVYTCQDGLCFSACTEINADFTKSVVEKTPESATAVYNDGVTEEYLKTDLDAFGGSRLRQELSTLDIFLDRNGTVELTSLAPTAFALADGTTVPAQILSGRFAAADGDFSIEYTVGNDVPGFAELLFVRIMDQKIFKVKAFSRTSVSR